MQELQVNSRNYRTADAIRENRDATEALSRFADIATQLGTDRIAKEAAELHERVSEGRFYVACVGQSKRGKSTVIGALVGKPILPTGIVPVTTVPTVVRYGTDYRVRVRTRSGGWQSVAPENLQQYVSEELNPENTKGVEGAEVFFPSPLLSTGMCLVDTPGLGSVFGGNTAATQDFIPHIDAAIVVIGSDPPIAGEELLLVQAVSKHVKDILLVLNKADKASQIELQTAARFSQKMLKERIGRAVNEIYCISAAQQLSGRELQWDWEKFVNALQRLVDESGRSLIQRAAERGRRRLGEQLLAVVKEERSALLRPVEESERRVNAMRQTIAEAERSMNDLGYLFTAEQHRLSDLFLSRRKAFFNRTLPVARQELQALLRQAHRGSGPSFRRTAMRLTQEIAEKYVLPWLQTEEEYAEQLYREAAKRFVDQGNDFLRKLADSGIPELTQMPHALDAERGFRTRSQFRFYDFITIAQPASPLLFMADLVRGAVRAFGSIEKDADEFLSRLLESNSTRVQSDVNERILESRHRLEADIRILLRDVIHVAERALQRARAAQQSGAAAVVSRIERLNAIEQELTTIAN